MSAGSVDTWTTVKVAAYTGGRAVPSARFRVRQYVPELRRHGVLVNEVHSRVGAYPPRNAFARPLWGIANLGEHFVTSLASYGADVTLLQREFLSTFFTLEGLVKRPVVLDVDDAIWIYGDGRCARRLAHLADKVICGNSFLADRFSIWNEHVEVIPTSVDTGHFRPAGKNGESHGPGGKPGQRGKQGNQGPPGKPGERGERFTLLWMGSSSNLTYLYDIEDALSAVLAKHPSAVLRVVCDRSPELLKVPTRQCEFLRWNETDEVRFIQQSDLGLMPLRDTEWERGKCSFKMLTYMACGLPVVASAVGMNIEVLGRGEVGFGARTRAEWESAVEELMSRPSLGESMGRNGREVVRSHYSVEVNAGKLGEAIRSVTAS
jgi:glycosyltransferase involved in cell wall biosynthesis